MPRHIDADMLREKMYHKAFEEDSPDQKWDIGCWIRYRMFEDTIESIPTADVVPVVRCKECIFWQIETEPVGIECEDGEEAHYCSFMGISRTNDYCSWAERGKNVTN